MEQTVIVVGGGVIGLLTARELALAGRDVTVLERNRLGRESSWAGGGILSPLYPWRYPESVNVIAGYGPAAYRRLAEELAEYGDFQYQKTGMMILDTGEIDEARTWAAQDSQRILNLIDQEQARALQPGLQGLEQRAIWMNSLAHVRNPRLLKALVPCLRDRGVRLLENTPVKNFRSVAGGVVVETGQGERVADKVVVCAGAWSGDLLKRSGINLPVQPVKGQMLVFEPAPGLVKTMVMKNGRYLIPRRDGRTLIGSTLEQEDYDKTATSEAMKSLRHSAIDMIPAIADLKIEHHWAGLRPGTPDGVPYIGEHPEIPGLYVNAGQFRNGLVMAPGSARLAADLVLGRDPVFAPEPYQLS